MKHLKTYKIFESIDIIKLFENFEDIDSICQKFGIENYIINSDGSIDVDGNVDLIDKGLTKLPLKFRNVTGDFDCRNNKLTSLEYAPLSVGGGFFCNHNPVESIWNLFIDYSQVDMLNDYDPVRDGQIIILDRLNEFLEQIGKQPVTKVKGYKCI